jgi:hypothetical protein
MHLAQHARSGLLRCTWVSGCESCTMRCNACHYLQERGKPLGSCLPTRGITCDLWEVLTNINQNSTCIGSEGLTLHTNNVYDWCETGRHADPPKPVSIRLYLTTMSPTAQVHMPASRPWDIHTRRCTAEPAQPQHDLDNDDLLADDALRSRCCPSKSAQTSGC